MAMYESWDNNEFLLSEPSFHNSHVDTASINFGCNTNLMQRSGKRLSELLSTLVLLITRCID